ncbi:hypothetical protein VKT23_002792 [Stygiomarasmius scandens]|uniref:N-acetyltransferase domain-containing protein n=1 Tax=Marasmiellus scandens TaxID=2682957 RepID=A0ABR1JV69_9AGAR
MAYIVKNQNSLPQGRFSIRLHGREHTLGAIVQDLSDRYIIPANADIIFRGADENLDGPGTKIGHIAAVIVLLAFMLNSGHSNEFQMTCDEHSRELNQMASALFDAEGNHKNRNWEEQDQGDLLYIQEVYLEPQWRGYGIGLLAVRGLMSALPSFEMDKVILNPVPSARCQHDPDCYPSACSLDASITSLTKYWSLLDFQKVSQENGVHYMEIWTGRALPELRAIVPHLFH